MNRLSAFAFLLLLCACAITPPAVETKPQPANLILRSADYSALPGWHNDALTGAIPALEKSCARILKADSAKPFATFLQAGTYDDWQRVCRNLQGVNKADNNAVRVFFEQNFQPYEVSNGGDPKGLFTGYYQASLKGSRTRGVRYNVPLYSRPDDLVMVDLGAFRDELKGQRIAGRVQSGNLKPYEDRAAIVAGRWPHNDKVLVWVDDAVDAFFVQVQGSGIVELEGGGVLPIAYAGQNGHIYTAIGKELVKRGALKQEDVSMQSIRAWLNAHPDQADEIMNTNRSYVFFEEGSEGAKGGEGVVLTAERSLAIDRSLLPYGAPVWLDAAAPGGTGRLQRLMVAQDTGGAITGPVRGDVFWGYGERAEMLAGSMKSSGQHWILLPKH